MMLMASRSLQNLCSQTKDVKGKIIIRSKASTSDHRQQTAAISIIKDELRVYQAIGGAHQKNGFCFCFVDLQDFLEARLAIKSVGEVLRRDVLRDDMIWLMCDVSRESQPVLV
jgi:hypothetical protein